MLGAIHARMEDPEGRASAGMLLAVSGIVAPVMLWFLAMWRAHQIEGRLRELAEREKAIEMARRLAAAQVEPHFLFNTLASVQHWVETKDDRAAPLLAALTGYLRATLPLFNKPLLAAGDELLAVRRYLEVMQARMGARLAWRVEVPAELERAELPPGLLLTLVENAVEHGVEPQLHGGEVVVSGQREGVVAVFSVRDSGPGMAPGCVEGVGLGTVRERLALLAGAGSELRLGAATGGGCLAEIRLPYKEAHA
jgi:LytS/YehU family sensor histidine kinase